MANIFVPTPVNVSGPWNIAREDCIGDSLGYINANTNYLAYTIQTLSATSLSRINSLSGETINSNIGAVVTFQDQKPSGTNGGAPPIKAWVTRDINTKVIDTNNLCSAPDSNTFTLPVGTWHIVASAPGYRTTRHRCRLYNITDGVVAALGTSEYSYNGGYSLVQTRSFIDTVVQINNNPRTYKIEHYAYLSYAGGLGVAAITGDVEVYTIVSCTKIK